MRWIAASVVLLNVLLEEAAAKEDFMNVPSSYIVTNITLANVS